MSSLARVDPAEVHAAVAGVAPRVTALIRSIEDPTAHAVGHWNAGDVALHLAHAWEVLSGLAGGELGSPLRDIDELGALTASMVSRDSERDVGAIADRIDAQAAKLLDDRPALGGETLSPWLVEGVEVPRLALACHVLSETLVHGDDIARAERRRWTIEPGHAGLALMGFVFPLLSKLDPRAMVDQEKARGFEGGYDVSVRGVGHVWLDIRDGAMQVSGAPQGRVDCHISADPAALLLTLFSRRSQWSTLLTGRMSAWGVKPWLALKLRVVVRNP